MGFFHRLTSDIVTLRGAWRSLRMTMHIGKNPTRIFPNVMQELAAKYGDAPALISDREQFTYNELFTRSNRYSRWALREGLEKGDAVCLLMPNRPDYFAAWLGITRTGGVMALLNTNLTGTPLAHCIDLAKAKHIIVAAELRDAFERVKPLLKTAPKVWLHGGGSDAPRIDSDLEALSGAPLAENEHRALTVNDRALYIYTSGTTGLPKAANVNHYRIMLACFGFAGVMDVRASDRMYDCLPMYHTVGGLVAIGPLLVMGGSTVIREKFSAREFFDDVVRYDCTLVQYIGELCRYLINSPHHPNEKKHRLRLACGNGLRPDIWDEFKARFRIPQIVEFYAATEGNVLLFNFEGKSGAIGRLPWYLKWRFPTEIVKFDVEAEQPVRDAQGHCIVCAPDEVGEAIGKIVVDPNRPGGRFDGYANRQDDERKILRNVFADGDAWFRTGDLMRRDKEGYFYFVDRVGDTFRWKGENVSTTEVAEAINTFPGISDTTVYGVQIPHHDGRAGMAAVVCEKCDLKSLYRHIEQALPDYARPIFIRMRKTIDVTSTFKQKKIDLVREGFDPSGITDPVYFRDSKAQTFVPVDKALYDAICSGKMRL